MLNLAEASANCVKLLKYQEIDLMPEQWVSVEEVASHLGVTKDSVYRWIEKRKMPAHKIGRLWKFKISEVDKWVRTGSASSRARRKMAKGRA